MTPSERERRPIIALRRQEGELDDVVAKGVRMFRAEMMDAKTLWVACYFDDAADERLTFSVRSKRGPLIFDVTECPSDFEEFDAAGKAAPMVPNVAEPGCAYVVTPETKWLADDHAALEERVEKAEAAARDFARALRRVCQLGEGLPDPTTEWLVASNSLARHPSFSGEEGTG